MATRKRKKSARTKPVWERGYQGHVLWQGKAKLGKVTRLAGHFIHPRGKYEWEAAGRAGQADDLKKAKAAVEYAVSVAGKQRDLFE
ncbi:MAG TPA: hypothetical protein VIS77_04635 [Burkholderiales bacterium]